MAREESNREDLLHEATALVERIEFAPPDNDEHVVVGFRVDGAASIFFGADPVYQFTTRGQLRRAYCDGRLYKAEHGCLVALERNRSDREVQLRRQPLTPAQQAQFLAAMDSRLSELAEQIRQRTLAPVGQVPTEANVTQRVLDWLSMPRELTVATVPNLR